MRQLSSYHPFAKILWTFVAFALACSVCSARNRPKLVYAQGGGTSTLTSVVENADGTLSLEAEQKGSLSHFGDFTGLFRYTAYIDYTTGATLLLGEGYLQASNGDQLFLELEIAEPEPEYPKTFTGTMRVVGGTGRCQGAVGLLYISGVDEESPEDAFQFGGIFVTGLN
jgi:hypothetical protein